MPDYDFRSLSSYDFENLVRDLLQKELGLTLECFTIGRDEGIDLRYRVDKETQAIIQCKHFAGSRYSKLYSHLKQKELEKVRRAEPNRYILATSVSLTPLNKNDIMELFDPYILSERDIYGRDDLNNLLGKYSDIEKNNFKLWLTSQAVLNRVLHNGIYNQTDIELESIQQKIKYYVRNTTFKEAQETLEQKHYCIIAGIPGIGKTMLAEMLSIEYLSNGYELIKIISDISEAFEVYNQNNKQIFFYDDFLGQTSLENKFGKNEEQKLIRFIEKILRSPNKRLILTTREYILNKAKGIYEKLNHVNYFSGEYLMHLINYTDLEKAQILFNYLYFSDLSIECKEMILRDKNYLKIIHHPNFNPRIIETMIINASKFNVNNKNYFKEFLDNLENPRKIWEFAFDSQLSESSRILLLVLATLPHEIFFEDLQNAFDQLYRNRSVRDGFNRDNLAFRKSLKELDGSFIKIDKSENRITIQFDNPSILDFMKNFINENKSIIWELCESIIFFNQCEHNFDFITLESIEKLLDSMLRTFKNKDCDVHHALAIKKNYEEYKEQAIISLESRIIFTINIWIKFNKNERLFQLIQSMLLYYSELLEQQDGEIDPRPTYEMDTNELAEFIGILSTNKIQISDRLFVLLEPYFLLGISHPRHFKNAINFIKISPRPISAEVLINLKQQFEVQYQYYLKELDPKYVLNNDSLFSPAEIDEYISLLKEIGEFFEIDILEGICKLEEIKIQFEKDMEEPDTDLPYGSWRDDRAIYDTDEEINKIFSYLDKS